MHFPTALLAVALALPTPLVHAQAAGQWESPAKIYDKVCAWCHETAVAPVLLGRELSPDYVRLAVSRGLGAMPAFRPTDFSDGELDALGRFVQTQPPRRPAQPTQAAQPEPKQARTNRSENAR